ncbi:hypothetical protein [Chengkuizengella marina]|uniref:hypothetical protein n=1 Tax=Chengkuizengella marina TaxID=2507566 RepID=UPI0013684F79|nr:hypothetical protein [Chengkuizengella marina]
MRKDLVTMYRGIRVPKKKADEIREYILQNGIFHMCNNKDHPFELKYHPIK